MAGAMPLCRRRTLAVAILGLALSGCALLERSVLRDGDHPLAGKAWDMQTASFVAPEDVRRRMAAANVVLLGETHDNPEHHRLQSEFIQGAVASGSRPTILMEQFDVGQQAEIDAALARGGDPAALMRGWDITQYRGILDAARSAGLRVVAANLPRLAMRPVVREGYATLAAGETARLALDAAWDAERERFMAGVIEASHCGKVGPALRDGLVKAQRLRDAILADSAIAQANQPIVFILGRGHARRDVGVPRYLGLRRPDLKVLSIAMVEVQPGKTGAASYEAERIGGLAPYDIILFTPRAERPDPCLAFGK